MTRVAGVVVYRRGNRWSYRIELERHPLTNERQWEYKAGHATEDEAWTAAIRAKSGRANGSRIAPAKRLVSEFFTEWLDTIRDSVKPSTYTNYTDYRDAYVLPHIGNHKLQDVTVPC